MPKLGGLLGLLGFIVLVWLVMKLQNRGKPAPTKPPAVVPNAALMQYAGAVGYSYALEPAATDTELGLIWSRPEHQIRDVVRGTRNGQSFTAYAVLSPPVAPTTAQALAPAASRVLQVALPAAVPTPLLVGPKNALTAALALLTIHGQQFESDAFNEKLFVGCGDRQLASAVIDPRMIETLLAAPPFSWVMRERWFYVVQHGALTASWIEQASDFATTVTAQIPPVVWSLYP